MPLPKSGMPWALACASARDSNSAPATAQRAPPWMRRRGLEWLHRLLHDPVRLAGRYLISDPKALAALAIAAFREKTP